MRIIEDIDTYLTAMKDIQQSINELKGERFLKNHQKTLLFSLLETISNGVYGGGYRNADRFKKFVLEFCEWEEAERVSLQQLFLVIKEGQLSQEFSVLQRHVFNGIQKYPPASPVPFSLDSTVDEVKALMPKEVTTINGVDIYNLTHVNLLWKYRNSLVHEARSLGSQELFDNIDYPHYIHLTVLEKDEQWEVWEISYPINFFNNLINRALVNIRERLIELDHNPYKNYDFGDLWVKSKQMKHKGSY